MLPFLTLVAVAAVLMGMLNSLGHFFIPALSPAMFNVATIVHCRRVHPAARRRWACQPIVVVAIGTLVGGLGQLAHPVAAAAAGGLPLSAACSTAATRRCGACCC